VHDEFVDPYDVVPYESAPVPEAHPGRLAVQARLFGLEAASPEHARVLELGCAEGGNLLPLAYYNPGATFVGVERSREQVVRAEALIQATGLSNARIVHAELENFDGDPGQFDYVIAHGLYSWVPARTRKRIFELCERLLAPAGVAFISCNTLPGWRMRGVVRDLLLFHVRNLADPRARFESARDLLGVLGDRIDGLAGLHAQYLREELAGLSGRDAVYVFHDFMEEVNEPTLFADFIRHAGDHGLQYLCDADLKYMFGGEFNEGTRAWLESLEDIVEREQYMDLLRGRNFRATLLCRTGHELAGEIDTAIFDRLAMHALLVPKRQPNLGRVRDESWRSVTDHEFTVSHPMTRAALLHLGEAFPDSVPTGELLAVARAAVSAAGGPWQGQDDHAVAELVGLYVSGAVGADLHACRWRGVADPCPCATPLARAQATLGWQQLATPRHAGLGIDEFARELVLSLDGKTSVEEIALALGRRHGSSFADARDNAARLVALFQRHGVVQPGSGDASLPLAVSRAPSRAVASGSRARRTTRAGARPRRP